jgi:hypothetical protein
VNLKKKNRFLRKNFNQCHWISCDGGYLAMVDILRWWISCDGGYIGDNMIKLNYVIKSNRETPRFMSHCGYAAIIDGVAYTQQDIDDGVDIQLFINSLPYDKWIIKDDVEVFKLT